MFSVTLRADQIVGGIAINLLALGITGYLYVDHYGEQGTPDDLSRVPDVTLPLIKDIPFVGDAIGKHEPADVARARCSWSSLAVVPVPHAAAACACARSARTRARPRPSASSVIRTRYLAVIASGVLAALGGAYLSIGFLGSFNQNLTAGRGYIALAVVICGRWRPGGALGVRAACSASRARSRSGCRRSRSRAPCSSRRCRTC